MRSQRDAFGVTFFSDDIDFFAPAKSSLPHQRFVFSHLEKLMLENFKKIRRKTALSAMINRSALLQKDH